MGKLGLGGLISGDMEREREKLAATLMEYVHLIV